MTELRKELPPTPGNMAHLPLSGRGYPVPYFVAWLDENDKPLRTRGEGTPDFRVIYPGCISDCYVGDRCWVCGKGLKSSYRSFVIGPMCAVNRTSAEPPSHLECATYSAIACPFLSRPYAKRRDVENMKHKGDVAGTMIERNPGVTAVWTVRRSSYRPFQVPAQHVVEGQGAGTLFNIGEPTSIDWYREGRRATYEEVMESINSGLPLLEEQAEKGGDRALAQLKEQTDLAEQLVKRTTEEVAA
jgi:hypothetical protein